MSLPALPAPDRAAFLLDVDGTLLDFAPSPMEVVVPPDLPGTLLDLKRRVSGALGMVSGRPIEQVTVLFGEIPTAIAGEHGGAIRYAADAPIDRPVLPELPGSWLVQAEQLARAHPGAMLEVKARGFVLHYRNAPDAGPALRDGLAAVLADSAAFELMPAQMAWEVRPRGADKGAALEALMRQPPFAGRVPVFIGDDVTDAAAIRQARAVGGVGLWVAETFGNPAGVRAWLGRLAAEGW